MNDEPSNPVLVRLSPDRASRLDDWRRTQKDPPGRPEAIRRAFQMEYGLCSTPVTINSVAVSFPEHRGALGQ